MSKQLHLIAECSTFDGAVGTSAGAGNGTHRTAVDRNGKQCVIDAPDRMYDLVLANNVLPFVADPRKFIAECFAKCDERGRLTLIVPDQFLDDRVWQPPSLLNANPPARRLYTPAALLLEVEEALAPGTYRIEELKHGERGPDNEGHVGLLLSIERLPSDAQLPVRESGSLSAFPGTLPQRNETESFNRFEDVEIYATTGNMEPIAEVCVLKLDHRGDFLLAHEAFLAIRRGLPQARITLLCGSWNRQTAQDLGLFDDVVCFDAFPEDLSATTDRKTPSDFVAQFAEMLGHRWFDLAIDLRTFGDTRPLLKCVQATVTAGFDAHMQFDWLTVRLPYVNQEQMRQPAKISREVNAFGRPGLTFERTFRLERGLYLLKVQAVIEEEDTDIECVLLAHQGRRIAFSHRAHSDRLPVIEFEVVQNHDDLDLLLCAASPFRVLSVELIRRGLGGYVNQAEAMCLLVYFALMRLKTRLELRGQLPAREM